jgi:hypothetical protein
MPVWRREFANFGIFHEDKDNPCPSALVECPAIDPDRGDFQSQAEDARRSKIRRKARIMNTTKITIRIKMRITTGTGVNPNLALAPALVLGSTRPLFAFSSGDAHTLHCAD